MSKETEKLDGLSLPPLRGILPIDNKKLASDILAGVTLAALGIPEVMGYTKISGTPIVTGLYTLLLPVIAFALLGGSHHLVVAADAGVPFLERDPDAHILLPIPRSEIGGAGNFPSPDGGVLEKLAELLECDGSRLT